MQKSQYSDLLPYQVLPLSPEFLEPVEDLHLGLFEVDLCLSGEIINDCHIVLETTQGRTVLGPHASTVTTQNKSHGNLDESTFLQVSSCSL